jgi:hypothetical protein
MRLTFLSGPIEKGANDGQIQYAKDVVAALNAELVKSKAPTGTVRGTKTKKGRRKNGSDATDVKAKSPGGADGANDVVAKTKDVNWGLFEPLRPALGPLCDGLAPMYRSRLSFLGIIMLLLLIIYHQSRNQPNGARGQPLLRQSQASGSQRVANYEALWLQEESQLWDWLEDRMAVHNLQAAATPGNAKAAASEADFANEYKQKRKASLGKAGSKGKAAQVKLSEQDVKEAIAVTEERLKAFKDMVHEKA